MPMGYLLAGRIGTGKTYLVECLAGEIGIPCVELRNFREKWVGATEGNLEKVFSILHALGQVIVFVDEADQMTGKRGGGDGDSGLSGRVYAMLAKEMSDTAQPREDHLDLRHLAAPTSSRSTSSARGGSTSTSRSSPRATPRAARPSSRPWPASSSMPIAPEDLPRLPDNDQIGGNEMEGILVRALRDFETAGDRGKRDARPGAGGRAACAPASRGPSRTSGPRPTSSGSSSWTFWRSRSARTPGSCPTGFDRSNCPEINQEIGRLKAIDRGVTAGPDPAR